MTVQLTSAIFQIFEQIGNWIMETLTNLTDLFWVGSADGGSFTFLGILALVSLGISVIFLMIRVIQNFLHFRG